MKSDITRDTFDAAKHFSRVISQQGRVTLDADSNEQTSILLHYLRTLARDLIGPYAAPAPQRGGGFVLSQDSKGLWISAGRYYVEGILVENENACLYTAQPHASLPADDPLAKVIAEKSDASYWLYLDVWERHVTSLEDDSIREKALGGPDTCTRAEVVWQVRAMDVEQRKRSERRALLLKQLETRKKALEKGLNEAKSTSGKAKIQKKIDLIDAKIAQLNQAQDVDRCAGPLAELLSVSDASMAARVDPGPRIADACVTSPDSKYRGAENQLYRVEIHRGGVAGEATFKWSRDNGSVATAWLNTTNYDLQVANSRGFSAGNWVELADDVAEIRGTPGRLVRLTKVEAGTLSVDPELIDAGLLRWDETASNPRVRRWDQFGTEDTVLQEDGTILIKETPVATADTAANWIELEDAIQVQFAEGGEYRTGDYWLIPARVANGNIEWPESESDAPEVTAQVAPHGVVHYFAPLGVATWAGGNLSFESCYCEIEPLSSCLRGVIRGGNQAPGVAVDELPEAAPPPETESADSKRAGKKTK